MVDRGKHNTLDLSVAYRFNLYIFTNVECLSWVGVDGHGDRGSEIHPWSPSSPSDGSSRLAQSVESA